MKNLFLLIISVTLLSSCNSNDKTPTPNDQTQYITIAGKTKDFVGFSVTTFSGFTVGSPPMWYLRTFLNSNNKLDNICGFLFYEIPQASKVYQLESDSSNNISLLNKDQIRLSISSYDELSNQKDTVFYTRSGGNVKVKKTGTVITINYSDIVFTAYKNNFISTDTILSSGSFQIDYTKPTFNSVVIGFSKDYKLK